jgi:hypothetical protein
MNGSHVLVRDPRELPSCELSFVRETSGSSPQTWNLLET